MLSVATVTYFLYGHLPPISAGPGSTGRQPTKGLFKCMEVSRLDMSHAACYLPIRHTRSGNKVYLPSVVLRILHFFFFFYFANKYYSIASLHSEIANLNSRRKPHPLLWIDSTSAVLMMTDWEGSPLRTFKRDLHTCHFSHFLLKPSKWVRTSQHWQIQQSCASCPEVPWAGGWRALCPFVYFFFPVCDQTIILPAVLAQLYLGKYPSSALRSLLSSLFIYPLVSLTVPPAAELA